MQSTLLSVKLSRAHTKVVFLQGYDTLKLMTLLVLDVIHLLKESGAAPLPPNLSPLSRVIILVGIVGNSLGGSERYLRPAHCLKRGF